jgi:hypothetical protein
LRISAVVDLGDERALHEVVGIDLALQADTVDVLREQEAGRLREPAAVVPWMAFSVRPPTRRGWMSRELSRRRRAPLDGAAAS